MDRPRDGLRTTFPSGIHLMLWKAPYQEANPEMIKQILWIVLLFTYFQAKLSIARTYGTSGASQGALVVKNPPANAGEVRNEVGKIPWRRKRQPTPVFLPGESHGQRSLAGYSPQGHKELDMTE